MRVTIFLVNVSFESTGSKKKRGRKIYFNCTNSHTSRRPTSLHSITGLSDRLWELERVTQRQSHRNWTDWLTDWQTDWQTDWWFDRTDRQIDWQADWQTNMSENGTNWLTDWPDWLTRPDNWTDRQDTRWWKNKEILVRLFPLHEEDNGFWLLQTILNFCFRQNKWKRENGPRLRIGVRYPARPVRTSTSVGLQPSSR